MSKKASENIEKVDSSNETINTKDNKDNSSSENNGEGILEPKAKVAGKDKEGGSGSGIFSPVEYKGTVKVNGEVRDVSRKVYQRNDIDFDYFDEMTGLTNMERMQAGKPPIGTDGNAV